MAARIDQPMRGERTTRRPLWLSILAGFSLLLGIVTAIPQFYYVLFALHLVTIGPNSNLLGQGLVQLYLEWRQQLSEGGPWHSSGSSRGCVLAWPALPRHWCGSLDEATLGDSRWAYHGRDDLLCNRWLLSGRHLCRSSKRHEWRILLGFEPALSALPTLARAGFALPAFAF